MEYLIEKNSLFHFQVLCRMCRKAGKSGLKTCLAELKKDGLKVRYYKDYFSDSGIPEHLEADLRRFLEEQELVVHLDEQFAYHGEVFKQAVEKLRSGTGEEFEVGDAKEILDFRENI